MAMITGQLALLLVLVRGADSSNETSCSMTGGGMWDNNMGCTGPAFELTLPAGLRTLKGCVQMGMAGQAGDPNRMCIKAISCSTTDSADCKCSLHGGCGMSSANSAQSCIQKPALDKDKACFDANANGASSEASAASSPKLSKILLLLLLALVTCAHGANETLCTMTGGGAWDDNMSCTGPAFELTLPAGLRTLKGCVQMGMAGQAGDPNRMCIKATGCSSTDSTDCKCSLHGGCGMSSASGIQSCIHKPVLDKDKACFNANAIGGDPVASVAPSSTPFFAFIISASGAAAWWQNA